MSEQEALTEESKKLELTAAQRARIERNRLKAVTLKEAKLIPHPSAKINTDALEKTVYNVHGTHYIDSGGGFLVEETIGKSNEPEIKRLKKIPAPIVDVSEQPFCLECDLPFAESHLLNTFDYHICDKCYDSEDKHSLITRTEAKNEYLLKDCDLDKREPILKYIHRKNPHNPRWGEMKLYLHVQIERRALEVWGSEEALIEEKEAREEKKEKSKAKKYSKQLKNLRMNVRGSLYDKTAKKHVHTFREEKYDSKTDTYSKTCTTCNYTEEFEKM